MKVLYIDAFSGISGDMVLGAFIDAGLNPKLLQELPTKLGLPQIQIDISKKNKSGIVATKVDIIYPDEHVHRNLNDVVQIINNGNIPSKVQKLAIKIFTRLAEAEAEIHGINISEIHFHEVGALDAIIDITGAALAFIEMEIDMVISSSVSVGGGMVKIAHGLYPVPSPATALLLTGFNIKHGPVEKELVTPTGAAILSVFTENSPNLLNNFTIDKTAYGAGGYDFAGFPNVLRFIFGKTKSETIRDEILEISFNVDDMNPQQVPHVIESSLKHGALDAFVTPIIMKKGRPGHLFTIILPQNAEKEISELIFNETTTIGYRKILKNRNKLERNIIKKDTSLGQVLVKEIIKQNGERDLLVEFEECKRIAKNHNIPLKDVQKMINNEIAENNG